MANEPSALTGAPRPVANLEAGLLELENIVKEMEGTDLSLERSLELFEKGMALTDKCRTQLQEAETRVEMIMRKEGKYQPEPFSPSK